MCRYAGGGDASNQHRAQETASELGRISYGLRIAPDACEYFVSRWHAVDLGLLLTSTHEAHDLGEGISDARAASQSRRVYTPTGAEPPDRRLSFIQSGNPAVVGPEGPLER